MTSGKRKAIAIYGPTASGKSSLAIELSHKYNGIIVNSDSLQIYEDLKILTACPDEEDLNKAPHFLYNILPGDENCTALKYVKILKGLLDKDDRTPIIVGGTGLYLKAIMEGLSEIPEISEEIREEARNIDITEIESYVSKYDKEYRFRDEQRLRRAYEVIKTTGKSYTYWQSQPPKKEIDMDVELIKLAPEREYLNARCRLRFEMMFESGAIEEVEALLLKNYPQENTIMKAIGINEISGYLKGTLTKEQAIEQATIKTRQYAKRQMTWLRTQL